MISRAAEAVRADLRDAWRSIARMPLVALVVVLSLAAGIGVNTVVFSWVQARILEPIPGVEHGAAIRLIEPRSEAGLYTGTSWPEYLDMRERLTSFSSLFAARIAPMYVGAPGAVQRVFGLLVSDNYFTALGVRPALGRLFAPEDPQAAGNAPTAVISHRLWQTEFQGAADVIGRTARINGREVVIAGVTPERFQGTTVGLQFDVWLPAALASRIAGGSRELVDRSARGYSVMGRLQDGVSRTQAQLELDAFMRELARTYPQPNGGTTGEVLPFHESPRGPQRMLNTAVLALQAVTLLVLLAVCGNIANLMLAKASARQKEIGVRLALGARPWRIGSLLLTESLLLALAGAAAGAALAVWGTRALLILPTTGLPLRFQTSVDATALGFAIALAVTCGMLFGAAPALHLSRMDPQAAVRSGAASSGRSGVRQWLMGAQVALAMIVLLTGGLFVRAFLDARSTDPGFRRDGVMLAAYDVSGRAVDAVFARDLAVRSLDRVAALPFVERVAIASSVPLDIHGLPSRLFTIEGRARADGKADEALMNTVTPGYFDLLEIPILSGTGFSSLTDPSAPRQVVVNEAFARRYLADGEPLGRRISARGSSYAVAGVVRNSVYNAFGEPPTPILYFSYRDLPQARGEIHVRLRPGAPAAAAAELQRAMRDVDAELPVFNVRPMRQHIDTNLLLRKIPAQMFSVLGPMLLALAAIGIYAVVAYAVSLRTREIGVRLALGATGTQVAGTFVADTLSVAAAGALIGWSAAFVAARAFAPGGDIEVAVFATVPIVLMGVAALACWMPARRAAAVDPVIALRTE